MTYRSNHARDSRKMINFATKSTFTEILDHCKYSLKVVLHSLKLRKEVAMSYPFEGDWSDSNKQLWRTWISPDARLLTIEIYSTNREGISDLVFLKIDFPTQKNPKMLYGV